MKRITKKQIEKVLNGIDDDPSVITDQIVEEFEEKQPYLFHAFAAVDEKSLNDKERTLLLVASTLTWHIMRSYNTAIPEVTETMVDCVMDRFEGPIAEMSTSQTDFEQMFDTLLDLSGQPNLMAFAISLITEPDPENPRKSFIRRKNEPVLLFNTWTIIACLNYAEEYESVNIDDNDDDPLRDEIEQLHNRGKQQYGRFSASQRFKKLSDEQRELAPSILATFAEHLFRTHTIPHEECDRQSMETCCLEILPAEIPNEEPFFRAIAPVLAAFFSFMEDEGIHSHGKLIARAALKIADAIVERSRDSTRWSMAKQIVMQGRAEGYDMDDPEVLDGYFASAFDTFEGKTRKKRNATKSADRPAKRRPAKKKNRSTREVKRADPCPCGSSKKYKDCCDR